MKQYRLSAIIFYALSFTWGLPLTLIGCVVAVVLRCCGYLPHKWGYCWYFEVGKSWGGLELGIFFIKGRNDSVSVKNHEFGHGLQNCIYGFLMIPLICIPSAIRYWYRELIYKIDQEKYFNLPEYDDIWFEGQATKWGEKYMAKLRGLF